MTLLPASVMALSPANGAFLREHIVNMSRPDSVVRGEARERCEASFRLALKEHIPVVEAAETLLDAFRDDVVTAMLSGYQDASGAPMPLLKDVRSYPLGDIPGPPPLLRRLLDEEPAASSWMITEGELVHPVQSFVKGKKVGEEKERTLYPNGFLPLGNLQQLGEGVYEFLSPSASSVRRMPSLRTMLGVMALASVGEPAQVQFTTRVSTLPELRNLLENDLRPWCFDVSPYEVHGSLVDPYRGTLHDGAHQIMWNALSPVERRDMLAVHDIVRDGRDALPDGFISRPLSDYGLDIFLGGTSDPRNLNPYAAVFGSFAGHMAYFAKPLPPGVTELAQISHRRLQSDLSGHPRSDLIVNSFRDAFRGSYVHPVLG